MAYACKILADSVSPAGVRLTTFEVTFPRIVLAEFNTHRMLSRSSASSRAIPVEKRIAQVESDPFVPESFGRNQKGMQAVEALDGKHSARARRIWLDACDEAATAAWALAKIGVHKQLANRLIEPFLWHTVIVTATEWSNFFALRCHPDAQPEIRRIAEMMRQMMLGSEPYQIAHGGWHLPLCEDVEQLRDEGFFTREVALISAGRCARVSHLTHDGRRDPNADLALAKKLLSSGHMSPFEHVARPLHRGIDVGLYDVGSARPMIGNFHGWVQFRKTIANEDDFSMVLAGRGQEGGE